MNGKRQNKEAEQSKKQTPTEGHDKNGAKPRKQRGKRIYRILVAITAILLALTIGVLAWWKTFAKPPTIDDPDANKQTDVTTEDLKDIDPPVRISGDRKQDFYTFLVIGRDTGGGGNTDTILLMAYDCQNQKLNVMSIPRDTLVNVSWDIKKINSVYNCYGAGEKGINALGKEIAQLVGFVPDFQVILEWKALGELVDALGGVTYDVPRNMYYVDPSQNLKINIKKGLQKLNGSQAMQVVRFRDGPNGYANGDLGRIETQQGFLKAVVSQCLSIQNVTKINDLARVFTDNVKTNLTINNLAWFADKAMGSLSVDDVSFCTMPCQNGRVWSRNYHQKLSYVVPKTQELVSLVNERFNPYIDDLKSYELDIMFVNSDGTIGSSTGKLEDSKANTWVHTSSSDDTSKTNEDSSTSDSASKDNDSSSDETQSSTAKPSQPETTEPDESNPDESSSDTTDPDDSAENPEVVDGEKPEETTNEQSTQEPSEETASESTEQESEQSTPTEAETEAQPIAEIPLEPYAMEDGAGTEETVPE